MKRRVVITGLGAVTPIGNTVEEFWNGVRKGACGIGTITKFDTAEYKVHLAGEVKGFVAKERMDFKAARRMGTFSQYAVAAAKEAFADAGISMENEDPFRVGVLVGSGVGDLNACEQAKAKIDAGNPSRVNPFTVPVIVDVLEAGRNLDARLNGKAQTVRLTGAVVGVLAENDRLDRGVGGQTQRVKDVFHRRIDGLLGVFLLEEIADALVVFLIEFTGEDLVPVVVKMNHSKNISCSLFLLS